MIEPLTTAPAADHPLINPLLLLLHQSISNMSTISNLPSEVTTRKHVKTDTDGNRVAFGVSVC
jgi:hypothetical protein